jgi:ABC-type cobalamin/Fe3+-siderophores transport system ATPase subunit
VETRGRKSIIEQAKVDVHTGVCWEAICDWACACSGAGKSTLLDVLAGRLRFSSGTILVGGKMAKPTFFRSIASYVPQVELILVILAPFFYLEKMHDLLTAAAR